MWRPRGMLRETAAFSRVSPLTTVLAPQPSCSRATTENVRHKLFCGSTSPPFGHLSCPRRGKAYQQPAGVAAIMLLLREPEGCDSQPGASPWARAARILPAAMSIPGRQARYSFPPRHSFRALQRTARKRSPQATRLIPHLFEHLRGHSGTGKMRLPQGQAHFSYFILFLRRGRLYNEVEQLIKK